MAKTSHPHIRSPLLAIFGLLLTLAIILLMNFRFFVTSGPSMLPTYEEGEFLITGRLYGTPHVGDVVMLKYEDYYCMKRVAFVAGEDVSAAGYEGYWGSSIVPEGYVYVLGDNASDSKDSRYPEFGLVAISDIWGKPLDQRIKPS